MTTSTASLALRCPSCRAKLRASRQLLGQQCPCPRCKHRVTVRVAVPSDAEVNLILPQAETRRLF